MPARLLNEETIVRKLCCITKRTCLCIIFSVQVLNTSAETLSIQSQNATASIEVTLFPKDQRGLQKGLTNLEATYPLGQKVWIAAPLKSGTTILSDGNWMAKISIAHPWSA